MQPEFIVREFIEEDYADVWELWLETGLTNPERNDNLNSIKKTIEHNGVFFVIEHTKTKKVIGTSWITNDGRRLYLHHFGIKPEFQGKKMSHKLLEPSLKFAENKNMQIKLEVHEKNNIAFNLYKNAGFKYLGDYKVYIFRHKTMDRE